MITHDLASKGTDMWSLGCIIYELLTGSTLFKGNSLKQLYSNIIQSNFTLQDDLDEDAKDLIIRLCALCPYERLGAGEKNSGYSMEDLMDHPFFKGKKFKNRYKKTPPVGDIDIQSYSTMPSYQFS